MSTTVATERGRVVRASMLSLAILAVTGCGDVVVPIGTESLLADGGAVGQDSDESRDAGDSSADEDVSDAFVPPDTRADRDAASDARGETGDASAADVGMDAGAPDAGDADDDADAPPAAPIHYDPCDTADCWSARSFGPCGATAFPENFSTGNYNVHQYVVVVSAGVPVEISLVDTGGEWNPALLLHDEAGATVYDGQRGVNADGLSVWPTLPGRESESASLWIESDADATFSLFVTGWHVVDGGFVPRMGLDVTYILNVASELDCELVFPLDDQPDLYLSNFDSSSSSASFGAGRSGGSRIHAGCDLYWTHDDGDHYTDGYYRHNDNLPVYAVADGTITAYYGFYLGTSAIEVDHGDFVVRYGEVDDGGLAGDLRVGSRVAAGQRIGRMGDLDIGSGWAMLHFELFSGERSGSLTQSNWSYLHVPDGNYQRRADLMDCRPFLRDLLGR